MYQYRPKARRVKRRRALGHGPLRKAPSRIVVAIAILVSIAWIFKKCRLDEHPAAQNAYIGSAPQPAAKAIP